MIYWCVYVYPCVLVCACVRRCVGLRVHGVYVCVCVCDVCVCVCVCVCVYFYVRVRMCRMQHQNALHRQTYKKIQTRQTKKTGGQLRRFTHIYTHTHTHTHTDDLWRRCFACRRQSAAGYRTGCNFASTRLGLGSLPSCCLSHPLTQASSTFILRLDCVVSHCNPILLVSTIM